MWIFFNSLLDPHTSQYTREHTSRHTIDQLLIGFPGNIFPLPHIIRAYLRGVNFVFVLFFVVRPIDSQSGLDQVIDIIKENSHQHVGLYVKN